MQNLENEIWKDIKNYEGKYQISNFGRFKSLGSPHIRQDRAKKDKLLKIYLSTWKYLVVRIPNKTILIHRAIAETFIPNPENKKFINHIDGNKLNNDILNLEWVTRSENNKHAWDAGLQPKKHNIPKILCEYCNSFIGKNMIQRHIKSKHKPLLSAEGKITVTKIL